MQKAQFARKSRLSKHQFTANRINFLSVFHPGSSILTRELPPVETELNHTLTTSVTNTSSNSVVAPHCTTDTADNKHPQNLVYCFVKKTGNECNFHVNACYRLYVLSALLTLVIPV